MLCEGVETLRLPSSGGRESKPGCCKELCLNYQFFLIW